jgi:hypothetical protein
VSSPTQVVAKIGSGGWPVGVVSVVTRGGTGSSTACFDGLRFGEAPPPLPQIVTVTPQTGGPGTSVVISGTNFTGSTMVLFNGVPATAFSVDSAAQVTATVPAGATTGVVAVQNGSGWSFSTSCYFPGHPGTAVATVAAPSGVGSTAATLNGAVDPEGRAAAYRFDYGLTTAYGSHTPAKAIAVSKLVGAALSGLAPGTAYHFRVEVTTGQGTAYSADRTFRTSG